MMHQRTWGAKRYHWAMEKSHCGAPGHDHAHPPIGREAARWQKLEVAVSGPYGWKEFWKRWTAPQGQDPGPPIKLRRENRFNLQGRCLQRWLETDGHRNTLNTLREGLETNSLKERAVGEQPSDTQPMRNYGCMMSRQQAEASGEAQRGAIHEGDYRRQRHVPQESL
jgi:hypothetical protein